MNDEFNSIPNVDKNADYNYWLKSLYTIILELNNQRSIKVPRFWAIEPKKPTKKSTCIYPIKMFLFDMKTSRKLCVDDDFQKPQKSKQSGNMLSNHVCVCVWESVCVYAFNGCVVLSLRHFTSPHPPPYPFTW